MDINAINFVEKKYVKIMPDYCADPIWEIDGMNASLDWIPNNKYKKSLIFRLKLFADFFEILPTDGPVHVAQEVVLHELGLTAAHYFKAIFPDWTVEYWNDKWFDVEEMGIAGRCFEVTKDMDIKKIFNQKTKSLGLT